MLSQNVDDRPAAGGYHADMPSPFPGMDPYLEPHWRDIHSSLITECRRHLNRSLPEGLVARSEERIAIDADGDVIQRYGPDSFVTESPGRRRSWDEEDGGGLMLDAPIVVDAELEPVTERFIRVLSPEGEVITVVQFLRPSNKVDPGIKEFQRKRADLLEAGVHFVEIDLVRAGDWLELYEPRPFPPAGVATYRSIVRTAWGRGKVWITPIRLTDPLPDVVAVVEE